MLTPHQQKYRISPKKFNHSSIISALLASIIRINFFKTFFHPLGWDYLKHLTSSIHNSRSSESKKVANISLYQLSNFSRFTSLKLSSFNYSSSSSDKYFIIPSRISLAIFSSRSFIPLAFFKPR